MTPEFMRGVAAPFALLLPRLSIVLNARPYGQ
jgi:hypothetical protein